MSPLTGPVMAPALWGIPVVQSSTDRTVQFPTPQVYQRVHNLATGNIELWDGTQWKSAIPVTLDATSFGAVGDSIFDNAGVFANISAAVNAVATGTPVTVNFPDGIFTYTSGLVFTREVTLKGTGTLNYLGTGIAIKMGPDNFNVVNEPTNRHYIVDGLGFIGGSSMTQGIYFNTLVTCPRVLNCKFYLFGNATAWGIFGQSSNWDFVVWNCDWETDSTSTGNRNWIKANGYDISGTADQGQSQLRVFHCHALEQGFGAGICISVNGVSSQVCHNNIAGFAANVQCGAYSSRTKILDNYFETTKGTECIRYGDSSGAQMGAYPQYLRIRGNYCNLHNSDAYNTTASFIGNASSQTGIQYAEVRDNDVALLNAGRELIRQAANTSQNGNKASGNSGHTLLHTAGVDEWFGEDERLSPVLFDVDGTGYKAARLPGGVTVPANTTIITAVVSWITPFPDRNYTPGVTLYDNNNNDPAAPGAAINLSAVIYSYDGTGITVSIKNPTGGPIKVGVAATGTHD